MTNEEIAVNLAKQEEQTKSNTRRIEDLEADHVTLNRLVTSVEVIAAGMKNMTDKMDKIDNKIEKLESVPSDRWNTFIGCIISAVVSAAITFLVHKFL